MEELENPKTIDEKVRFPLSPIRINLYILYHFFELIYPKFINDQQNILDIVISKEDKKNKVLGLYLYETKKAGIHGAFKSLPGDLIRSKYIDIERLDNFFDTLQTAIVKETGIRISSIRIFKKEAIDLINKYCEGVRTLSLQDFLTQILDLIQTLFERNLFLIYPKPVFQNFFVGIGELLKKIRFNTLFNFVESILPELKISFLIESTSLNVIFFLQKKILKSGKSDLTLKIFTPYELGIEIDNLDLKNRLNLIQEKLQVEKIYYFKLSNFIYLISNLFELCIPINKDNIELLMQKILFGYRSFEKHWDMAPRPMIYNTFVRFLIRLFGFNFNLRKLSHWAIPDLIFSFINFYFGLNCKILLLITDAKNHKKPKSNKQNYLKIITKDVFLLEIEKNTLTRIELINKNNIFSGNDSNSLNWIKVKASEKFGFISSVIMLDKMLLQNAIKSLFFNHFKLAPFSKMKLLKMMKKQEYFRIYPEIPPYQLIKKKRIISTIKLILPIMIDKHEF